MKIFRDKVGRILQLAEKEKIQDWSPEMPLIYIGNIREKRIPQYKKEYSTTVIKEVEQYLDEILKEIAIPKLIGALKSDNTEERLQVAQNFVQISRSNPDLLKIALSHIEDAWKEEKVKDVKGELNTAIKNYQKAQKRKKTAKKRENLRKLAQTMTNLDRDYADGKINDADYMKQRKEFLKLQREIELEEAID